MNAAEFIPFMATVAAALWLGLLTAISPALAAFAVYKFEFAPVEVVEHTVARGEIVAEVMGTGTLEARGKTTVSARIQERLAEVLLPPGFLVRMAGRSGVFVNAGGEAQCREIEVGLRGKDRVNREGIERGRSSAARCWWIVWVRACGSCRAARADLSRKSPAFLPIWKTACGLCPAWHKLAGLSPILWSRAAPITRIPHDPASRAAVCEGF